MAISPDAILSLGDDQLANQFSIVFPNGIPGGGDSNAISLRCDQTFDPPENVINVYELFHKGYKIPKTGMLQETTKEFTIDIRLDQSWKVYDDLQKWVNMSYDHNNGTALPEIMARSTVIVQAEDRNQSAIKKIHFKYAKPKSVKIQTFDNQSGDPLRITVIFIYVQMDVTK
jgi:hypothetical protein